MQSLLDSIWGTEDNDVIINAEMVVNCIIALCSGTKPPVKPPITNPDPEPSLRSKYCAVPVP